MSVRDEITRIETAKSDIEAAIEACGVDVPDDKKISTYAAYISKIPEAVFSELNVDSVGGNDSFIKTIEQVNGKINATTGGLVSSSNSGLAPAIGSAAASTITTRADEWVLTSTKGAIPTWRKLPDKAFLNTTYAVATNTTNGLMSSTDKAKLDSINNNAKENVQSDWNETSTTSDAYIKNKPIIPTVRNSSIKIQVNGSDHATFTLNQATDKTINIPNTTYSVVSTSTNGLAPKVTDTTKYLRGDGTWATPTNTTYTAMTPAEAKSGTATTARSITAKVLHDKIAEMIPILSLTTSGDGNAVTGMSVSDHAITLTKGSTFSLNGHTHATNKITALTGYSNQHQADPGTLTTSDTLNQALAKLAYRTNYAYNLVTIANNKNGEIENLQEILDVLSGIKDTETIKTIVGNYLPLSGGQMSGNVTWKNGTGHSTTLPGHIFRNTYNTTDGNVYDHYFPSECTTNTFANLRVRSVDSATNFKVLRFGGDGTFTWNGNPVVHSKTPTKILNTVGTYKLWASVNQQSPKYCDTITYTVTKNSDNSYTKLFNVNASMNVASLSVTNLKVTGGYGQYKTGWNDTTPAIIYTRQFDPSSYYPILKVTTSSDHVFNLGGIGNTFGIFGYHYKEYIEQDKNGVSYGVYFDLQTDENSTVIKSLYPHDVEHTLGRYYKYIKTDGTTATAYNQWGCVYTKKIERRDGTALHLTSPSGVALRYNDSDTTSVILNDKAFKPYAATAATTNGINLGTDADRWNTLFSKSGNFSTSVLTPTLYGTGTLNLRGSTSATNYVKLTNGSMYPNSSNTLNLGASGYEWSNVYAKKLYGTLNNALTIKLDGGNTTGTTFTFNNSGSTNINITPESIRTSRVVVGVKGSNLTGTYGYKIGTLPASSGETYDSLHIVGNIGGWESYTKSVININIGRRGGNYFTGVVHNTGYEGRWDIGIRASDGAVLIITKDTFVTWSLEIFKHLQGTINVSTSGEAIRESLSSLDGISLLSSSTYVLRTKNPSTANGIAYFDSSKVLQSHTNIKVSGNSLQASGGFYEESDERLKTFYDDVKVDFDKLSKIPKKYFTWNERDCGMQIGTSAQEIQKIYPELVNCDENGTLNVSYSKLSIIALKAIDQLCAEIEDLKLQVSCLKTKTV